MSGSEGTEKDERMENRFTGYANQPFTKEPHKLNDAAIKALCSAIRAGLPLSRAPSVIQASYPTFRRWMAEAEQLRDAGVDDDVRVRLINEVERAQADFMAEMLARISKAGEDPRNWTANAWLLERRFPRDFGKRYEVTGADGGALNVVVRWPEQDADADD